MGRQAPATGDLLRFVGPPLRGTFEELLDTYDGAQLDEAIRFYRSRFATVGIFENALYPEVHDVLSELRAAGHRLWVVTSKPHVFARRIIDHFRLTSFFEDSYGSELSGENTSKVDLIGIAVEHAGLARHDTWLIGDRAETIVGATA